MYIVILKFIFSDAEIMALNNFTVPKHTAEMKFPWEHYYNSPVGQYEQSLRDFSAAEVFYLHRNPILPRFGAVLNVKLHSFT